MVKKYIDDKTAETDPLLTPAEVARMFGVSRAMIYLLIARGQLRAARIGNALRLRPRDVQDYIRRRSERRAEQMPKPGRRTR